MLLLFFQCVEMELVLFKYTCLLINVSVLNVLRVTCTIFGRQNPVEVSPLKRSHLSVRKARDDMHRGLHGKFVWYRMGQM